MPPIGEILVRKELISPRALAQVLKDQPNKRQRLISMLILRAELEIDDGATVLSEHTGYPAAYERHLERRDPAAVKLLPGALCAQYAVICLGKTAGGRLIVGARDPSPELAATIEQEAGVSVSLAVVPALLIERLVKAAFGAAISESAEWPATNANLPRAKSLSALYADATPAVAPTVRQPTPKVTIPENPKPKSGAVEAVSDAPSAPILLDQPKPAAEKTQPRMAAIREPARGEIDETAVTQTQRAVPAAATPIQTMPLTRTTPRREEPAGPPAIELPSDAVPSVDMGALLGALEQEHGEETVPERPFARAGSEPAIVQAGVPREPTAPRRDIRPPTQPPAQPTRPSTPAMPPRLPPQAQRPPTQPPMPPSLRDRPSQPAMPPRERPSQPAMLRTTLPGHAPGPADDGEETTSVREETTAVRGPRRAPPPPSADIDAPTVGPDALAARERPSQPVVRAPARPVPPVRQPPPLRPVTDLPPPLGEVTPPPPADPVEIGERHRKATQPAPNLPIPAEARPPQEPFASVALSDLAAQAGATASDPAVQLKPTPLAERPAQRTKSVSEMFDDISNEPPPKPAEPPARPSAPPLPPVVAEPTARSAAPPPPRMPTEPTVNAGPPKPPPAPGTGSVDAVCKEIERAISRATADRVLITFAGTRFKTALLVMIVDGVAKGTRGQGPRLAAAAAVSLSLDQPSTIASAVESRALTHDAPASQLQDRLAELLVTRTPLAVPVIVDDSVVAVLAVGEAVEQTASEAELEKVVAAFATAYKRLYKPKA